MKPGLPRHFLILLAGMSTTVIAGAQVVQLAPATQPLIVNRISTLPDGDLCLVGEAPDWDQGTSRARVIVFDPKQHRVRWDETMNDPKGAAHGSALACRANGTSIYVGADVGTSNSPPLNRSFVYLYRFDLHGRLHDRLLLDTGKQNSFVYDIDISDSGIEVAGMKTATDDATETNAMFFASLDPGLKSVKFHEIKTGAYDPFAPARLTKGVAMLGGNFYPARTKPDSRRDDYAVSRLDNGRYQFSVRPQHVPANNIATTIRDEEEIISLGYQAAHSYLTVVNGSGKITDSRALKSQWCETTSMSANARTVFAVRKHCLNPKSVAVTRIDRTTLAEALVPLAAGTPKYVFATPAVLYVISETDDGAVNLETVAIGN